MATINASSIEKVKQDAIPIQMLAPFEQKGRIRVSKTQYTWLTGFLDIGSTVTGARLPANAKVVGGYLMSDAMAASGTLQVSINSVNLAAALAVGAATATQQLPDKDNYKNVEGVDFGGFAPVITTAGAVAVAGSQLALILFYVVD
jgi:hypothetical protein